jgi:ankyrin repeat protein
MNGKVADPYIKNADGKTAIDYAEKFGKEDELINLIKDHANIK